MGFSKSQLAVIALIVTNIIWGAAPPIFKWSLSDIHPFTLAFLRFSIPLIIMLPFVKGRLKVNKKDYFNIFLMGFFGITVNIIFFFQGLLQAPSINAALIANSGPIFIILISLFFLKEKPKPRLIVGASIGLLGVLIVLIAPIFRNGDFIAVGNIFFFIAMLGSIIGILIGREVMKRNNPVSITFWTMLVGSIGFFPFFVNEVNHYGFLQQINTRGVLGLIFGILLSSLVAYFLQNWALKYLSASDVSVFSYIDPFVTILTAAPLLSEYPDLIFVVGLVLVLGGIFIAEKRIHYHPLHLLFR